MFSDPVVLGPAVFLAVFTALIVLGGLWTLGRGRDKVAPRLRGLATLSSPAGAPAGRAGGFLRPWLSRLGRAGGAGKAQIAQLQAQCLQAGFFHRNAPLTFVGAKAVLTLALAGAGALGSFYVLTAWGGAQTAGGALAALPLGVKVGLGALMGAAVGMLAPSFWLSAQVRARQRLLRHALPDALDMLVLCLEGGVSVNAAMQRVTDELQIVHPVLALEMNIVQREMQLGLTAGEALSKFAGRCGLPGAHDLALVLLQSERYGAGVTKALRGYIEAARLERQQEAEEVAQKAAVKILFPTLLCIFPAIFVVVLGPAAFQMAHLFSR